MDSESRGASFPFLVVWVVGLGHASQHHLPYHAYAGQLFLSTPSKRAALFSLRLQVYSAAACPPSFSFAFCAFFASICFCFSSFFS